MHPILRNILALLGGLILGSIVNMALVQIGHAVVPLPEGADVSDMDKLAASMPLMGPQHFIFPFLAHALGTLVGAFIAAKFAASHKMTFAIVVGAFFLLGGITSAFMLPAPVWFIALDLILAYLPMGLLGGRLAGVGMGRDAS